MDALNLIGVNILSNNNQGSVRAETDTIVEFEFDRDLLPTDSPVIRCHLHDTVFDLEHYLPDDIIVSVNPEVSFTGNMILSPKYQTKLKFSEELAGAKIAMNFYMKLDPDDISPQIQYGSGSLVFTGAPPDPISKSIEITSSEGGPKIEAVYWANDDNIKFGEHSAERTEPVHRNEIAILHIHTRGLYGREINGKVEPFGSFIQKAKNNTTTYNIPMFMNLSRFNGQGNLTGRAKRLNDTSYSHSATVPLDLLTDNTIIPTTVTVISGIGQPPPENLSNDIQCRIEFRPFIDMNNDDNPDNYDGKYGFSWFRKGDMEPYSQKTIATNHKRRQNSTTTYEQTVTINNACNDHSFETTMGRHFDSAAIGLPRQNGAVIQDINCSSPHFDIDPTMIANHKQDYRKINIPGMDEYLIPIMTLRKEIEAKIRLFVDIRTPLEKVVFEFDNPSAINDGYLTVDPPSIPSLPVVTPYIMVQQSITIKCHKEFSKELLFRAVAYPKASSPSGNVQPQICGAIRLLPNDISHQRNLKVVFFNVKTKLNGTQLPKSGIPSNDTIEIDKLKKFLGQAYVIIQDFRIEDVNLSNETNPKYLGAQHTLQNEKVFNPAKRPDLIDFLKGKCGTTYQGSDYTHWLKVFFIADPCTNNLSSDNGEGGFYSAEYNNIAICFSAQVQSTTAVHEVGHALGLSHTFDGSTSRSKYVYQDGTTDNIMDYSDLLTVNLRSFFHWQWRAMNNQLP